MRPDLILPTDSYEATQPKQYLPGADFVYPFFWTGLESRAGEGASRRWSSPGPASHGSWIEAVIASWSERGAPVEGSTASITRGYSQVSPRLSSQSSLF